MAGDLVKGKFAETPNVNGAFVAASYEEQVFASISTMFRNLKALRPYEHAALVAWAEKGIKPSEFCLRYLEEQGWVTINPETRQPEPIAEVFQILNDNAQAFAENRYEPRAA